jgi:hypothetical protein
MYSRERRVMLRHYLEQGVGKTELARRFGGAGGRFITGSRRPNSIGSWTMRR